jgi:hypothetical protein
MPLQRVEEPDECAAVELERVGDRRLGFARALVQERQDRVVVRPVARPVELLDGASLDGDPEPAEQEQGVREQLRRHAQRGRRLEQGIR